MPITGYLSLNCGNINNTYIYSTHWLLSFIQRNNMKPQNKAELEVTPFAIALYQFNGRAEDELSFNVNDIILLTKHVDEQWTEGELDGKSGIFPTSFVTIEVDCPHAFTVNQNNNSIQANSSLSTCTDSELGDVKDLTYRNLTKLMEPEAVPPQLQNPRTRLKAPIKPIPKRPAPAPPQTTNAVRFGKEPTIPESNINQHSILPRNTALSKPDHTARTQCSSDVKVVCPWVPNKGASVANTVKDFPRFTIDSLGNTASIEKEGGHFVPIPAPRTSLLKDKDNAKVSKPPKPMSRNQVKTATKNTQERNAHLISPATNKAKPFIDLTVLSEELQALTVNRNSEPMPTVSETSDNFYSEIDTDIDSYYASIDTLDYRKPKTGQGFIGQMPTNDLSAENSTNNLPNIPESDKIHIRSPTNALTVSLSTVKLTAGAKNNSVMSKSNIKPIFVSSSQVKEPLTSPASKSQFFVPLLSNETSSADLKYANISTESPVSKNYPNELYDIYPHLAAKNDQPQADVENVYEDMTQFNPNSICGKTEYEVMSKVKPNSVHSQSSPPSPPPSLPPKKHGSSINSPFIPLL